MLAQVSTFKDLEEAEYFVAETIGHHDAIQHWLKLEWNQRSLNLFLKSLLEDF